MSKVFLVQNPSFKDATGGWVSKYDVSAAKQHGEVIELLPPGNLPHDLRGAVKMLKEKLDGVFGNDDHLLALGDPVAIAAAVAVLASGGQRSISVLKWDRRTQRYRSYVVQV